MLEHVNLEEEESLKADLRGDNGELDVFNCMPAPKLKLFVDYMK